MPLFYHSLCTTVRAREAATHPLQKGDEISTIIHRLHEVLLHAEVFLRGLDGGVTQQHLDLLEVAA